MENMVKIMLNRGNTARIFAFDDVFLAHLLAVSVGDEGDIIFGLVEVQIIVNLEPETCFDMVDDNTFVYTGDF